MKLTKQSLILTIGLVAGVFGVSIGAYATESGQKIIDSIYTYIADNYYFDKSKWVMNVRDCQPGVKADCVIRAHFRDGTSALLGFTPKRGDTVYQSCLLKENFLYDCSNNFYKTPQHQQKPWVARGNLQKIKNYERKQDQLAEQADSGSSNAP